MHAHTALRPLALMLILATVQGCASSRQPDHLSILANDYLKRSILKQSPGATVVSCPGGLSIGGKCISVIPSVETESAQNGKTVLAVRFDLSVDGTPDPRLVHGAVGIGDSALEASNSVVQEWAAGFALPLVAALMNLKPAQTTERHLVHAGLLALRGSPPSTGTLPDVIAERRLISIIDGMLPPTAPPGTMTTVSIMLRLSPDAPLDGECRKNGELWPDLLSHLKTVRAGSRLPDCVAKQYFIFVTKSR